MSRPVSQRGFLIIAAMALIVIVGFLVLALAYIFTGDVTSSGTHAQSAKALFIAETGIEVNTGRLLSRNLAPPAAVSAITRRACSNAALTFDQTDIAYGEGRYTVEVRNPDFTAPAPVGTGPVYSGVATLNGAIGVGDTTIIVNNPPGTGTYASSGRIMIDRELIDYRGTTPISFLNAVRGMDGSIPAPHVTGTRVGHYQCNLRSQGGVPILDLAANPPPDGFRWLNIGVQLQEGWAVGNGGNIFRWNGTAWAAVAPIPVATQLNSVSMLSYADGWAVGNVWGAGANPNQGLILRWTGGPNWNAVSYPAPRPDANLNSVYCVATNDCWAVGDPWDPGTGNQGLIMRWNGVAWAPFIPAVAAPNDNLRSVYCVATNDCWIVGDQPGGGGGVLILRWNGAAWTRIASVPATADDTDLNSVHCVAANDCWAVGDPWIAGAAPTQGLIMRWDGATWSPFTPPVAAPSVNLRSVHCVATNDCWIVGDNEGGGNEVILHWNGAAWARIAPGAAIPNTDLNSVYCVKSDDCWIVGDVLGGNEALLHWDGVAWTSLLGALPGQTLRSIYLIGARLRPQAGWQEDYR